MDVNGKLDKKSYPDFKDTDEEYVFHSIVASIDQEYEKNVNPDYSDSKLYVSIFGFERLNEPINYKCFIRNIEKRVLTDLYIQQDDLLIKRYLKEKKLYLDADSQCTAGQLFTLILTGVCGKPTNLKVLVILNEYEKSVYQKMVDEVNVPLSEAKKRYYLQGSKYVAEKIAEKAQNEGLCEYVSYMEFEGFKKVFEEEFEKELFDEFAICDERQIEAYRTNVLATCMRDEFSITHNPDFGLRIKMLLKTAFKIELSNSEQKKWDKYMTQLVQNAYNGFYRTIKENHN